MLCVETEEDKRKLDSGQSWGHAAGAEAVDMCKRRGCSCRASVRFSQSSLLPRTVWWSCVVAVAESGRGCGSDLSAFSGPQLTTTRS